MRLEDLKPAKGSKKRKRRVGRGTGSGRGTTAGRGTKGQGARSGGGKGPGFEGGQTPLYRRLPKYPGFNNKFKTEYTPVNIEKLNRFKDGDEVTLDGLIEKGIIKRTEGPVKLLGKGKLKVKIKKVRVHAASQSAAEAVEKKGGKVEIIPC